MSVAFPFRVYGENGSAVEGWRHERNPFFFSFCGVDDLQLHCQDITDTTPYSCGRRKFSLACSHAQRPLWNLQSLLLRLIQPVPLQIICCQKQFFSPDLLRFIGLMFNKKYAERKYTLFYENIFYKNTEA